MTLRVVGIGAGYFARFHHDAWRRIPSVRLVGICDRDLGRAEAMAAGDPELGVDVDAARMLDDLRPDLVDIATPPETHSGLVALAAARGIPVVCQKPLAPTHAEAAALVDHAERAGILLIVHENFRFQPWYGEIRRLIAAGALGEIYGLAFRMRPGDGQGPEAYLARQPYFRTMERFLIHETGIHFIDTFRYLLGQEIVAVGAHLRRLNPAIRGEDAGIVVFEFDRGATGVFDANRLVDHAADDTRLTMGEMWVEGAEAVLRLDGHGRLHLRPRGQKEREHAYVWKHAGFAGDSVLRLQSHVVAHLTTGAALVNDGRSYLRNLLIEEAVYASQREGRRIEIDKFQL